MDIQTTKPYLIEGNIIDKGSKIRVFEEDRIIEMATVGRKDSNKNLPKGMRLEVITSEYENTGEEPHLHLFPATHKDRNGKANNYDLITRVKVTDFQPSSKDDIVAIKDNPEVDEDYKNAIFEWSKETNKRGVNNWVAVQIIWDALNNR